MTQFTTPDLEVANYFRHKLPEYGLQLNTISGTDIRYHVIGLDEHYRKKGKYMLNVLRRLNNKHMPNIYKLNSVAVRLKILAGTYHGNTITIVQKSDKLAGDIEYLVFSLGFMVTRTKYLYTYKDKPRPDMCIFGEGLEHIFVILERNVILVNSTKGQPV